MEWDNENSVQLIQLYQSKPELWQISHKYHNNKTKKHEAWQEIAILMGSTVEAVKSKMNSLLSSFRRERVKEQNSIVPGRDETYKTKWFAYEAFYFLIDNKKSNKVSQPSMKLNYLLDSDMFEGVEKQEPPETEAEPFDPVNMVFQMNPTEAGDSALGVTDTSTSSSKKRKNELSTFGEHVANKLSCYDDCMRAQVEFKISKILYKADMKTFQRYEPQIANPAVNPGLNFQNQFIRIMSPSRPPPESDTPESDSN